MKIKSFLENYFLAKNVMTYREKKQNELKNTNEKCENYFRVNDANHDDRGDF